MKIGIIKEGKQPIDRRVPLSPKQCLKLQNRYPQISVVVQPSPIRCFTDQDYLDNGIKLQEDLSDCNLIMGIKEVPINFLIPEKKFLFFLIQLKNNHIIKIY